MNELTISCHDTGLGGVQSISVTPGGNGAFTVKGPHGYLTLTARDWQRISQAVHALGLATGLESL